MAKKTARDANISVNSVALEGSISSYTFKIDQETPNVTSFADAGPRRLPANYDLNLDISGAADFASGNQDATIAGLIGSTGVAVAVDPTGSAAGANDPNYDMTSMVLSSYQISGQNGGAAQYQASLLGNSAYTRAVA